MKKQAAYGSYKRSGSRTQKSYANSVSAAAAKKRSSHLNANIKLLLICLILPPLGVYLVWSRDMDSIVMRAVSTAAACLVMFFWFMALIPGSSPATFQYTKTAPSPVTRYAVPQAE